MSFQKCFICLACTILVLVNVEAGKHEKKQQGAELHLLDKSHPTVYCPDSYEMDNLGNCSRQIITHPQLYCDFGELHGDKCATWEQIHYQCPPGFIEAESKHKHDGFNSGACIQIEKANYIAECPHHTTLGHGGCISRQVAALQLICPVGNGSGKKHGENNNNGCYDYEVVPPMLTCANGLILENNLCRGEQLLPCPMPYIETPKKHSMRKLGKHDKKKHAAAPVSQGKHQMCSSPIYEQPFETCPPNAMRGSSHKHEHTLSCVVPIPIALQPYCPLANGIIDKENDTCFAEIIERPNNVCPVGFSLCSSKHKHEDGGCCRTLTAPLVGICTNGMIQENGRCAGYYPTQLKCHGAAQLTDGKCIAYDIVPAKKEYTVTLQSKGLVYQEPHLSSKKHH